MSGMDLITLGSISYSYYYNIRLRPYAQAFAFSHRLLGYIRVPGLPCFEDNKEHNQRYACPWGCQHNGYDGGKHAISCKRSGNHLVGHTFLEKNVRHMVLDALALLRAFSEADVYINDGKNSRARGNLTTTIPVNPCSMPKWGDTGKRNANGNFQI